MPRPTAQQVHVNQPLSNISIAYMNNDYIYSQVFPIVPVQKKSDLYFIFDPTNFYRNRSGPRAPGTRAPQADYSLTTASYMCINDSMATLVPDEVRENADAPLRPDVTATKFVSDALELAAEIRVATLITACANWASASNPSVSWSNDNSDPVKDLLTATDAVVNQIGQMPTVMAMGWKVWRRFQNHPAMQERLKYTRPGGTLSPQDLMAWTGVQKILIGKAIYETSQEGATSSKSFVWGNHLWVGYVSQGAALEEPSAGYVFRWGNRTVSRFRLQPEHADLIEAEWSTAERITASEAGAGFYSCL